MLDIAEKAIKDEGTQEFDSFRKLLAYVIAQATGEDADVAAAQADNSVFQKKMEYAVGIGEKQVDAAVEAMIDREACHLSNSLHKVIAHATEFGCEALGSWIGDFFWGKEGAEKGREIGKKAARILNIAMDPIIDAGAHKITNYVKETYHKAKVWAKKGGNMVKNWIKQKISG